MANLSKAKEPAMKQTKITNFLKSNKNDTPKINQRVDINKVGFKQLNNNKREVSMDEINSYCNSQKYFVVLGQEPNTRLGGLVGLNKRHTAVHTLDENPRSFIFASSNLHVWPMPTYTNRDIATALLDTHDPQVGKIVLCSFYWDILENEIPDMYLRVADFARSNGYILVTGSDSNAHSTLWNCVKDNKRGKKLEDSGLGRSHPHCPNPLGIPIGQIPIPMGIPIGDLYITSIKLYIN